MVRSIEEVVASSPDLKRARLAALSNLVKSKKSGHLEKYYQLLTDFNFLVEKINHPEFGVQALIEDYDLIDAPEATTHPEYNPEKVETLKRVQGALRLSAHVLAKDKTQLAGQLLGRLLPLPPVTSRQAQSQQKQADYRYFWEYIPWIGKFLPKYSQKDLTVEADPTATAPDINQSPIIQGLLEQVKQWKQSPWLRPLTLSLTSPGGRLLRTLKGHSDSVKALAVTADGKRAISGSSDNTLKLWNLETGQELFTLKGHSNSLRALAVTADGKRAISGSWDNTLKLWNLETGEVIASFTGDGSINCCAVAPDGVTIVAGEASGRVHFLRLEGMEASL
jgi:WD40 repeat protein